MNAVRAITLLVLAAALQEPRRRRPTPPPIWAGNCMPAASMPLR